MGTTNFHSSAIVRYLWKGGFARQGEAALFVLLNLADLDFFAQLIMCKNWRELDWGGPTASIQPGGNRIT